jgi:hypothetical protein
MAARSRTAKYYAANPEARKKKNAYQRKYNKKPAVKKASEERWNERRRRGIDGKGGKDLSHTKDGRMVLEDPKTNRARIKSGLRESNSPRANYEFAAFTRLLSPEVSSA